ncbi:MBL fold metallo-hydrolase [Butyrivibrio sp. AE2032]|uniref:MBL fold metallo-hydrolase n=1 Tax=Butyrivibrio sp. AE2032 TaxID=1458463 RepID=UPI000554ED04|nr:MBL fold metallo-hydrolase [Butyrivibrio sp. AE2032]
MLKFVAILFALLIPISNMFSLHVPEVVKDNDDYETPEIGETANGDLRIHYLKLNDKDTYNCDAIVIESNGHYGLVDAAWDDKKPEGESGIAVRNYLSALGVKHLDFVIATHSHSDHIGGMPLIVNDPNGNKIVDEKTVYFYKEYKTIPMEEIVEKEWNKDSDWDNKAYFDKAMAAMGTKGANAHLVDVSSTTSDDLKKIVDLENNDIKSIEFHKADSNNEIKDYISFKFGSADISLFNLYYPSGIDENANSIVTYLETNNNGTVLLADLDACYDIENKIGKVIKDIYKDKLKAVKIAHHGLSNATSKRLIDTLEPDYAVIQGVNFLAAVYPEHSAAFCLYLEKLGKTVYYTQDSKGKAIVEVVNSKGISFVDAKLNGNKLSFNDAASPMEIKKKPNCFVSWVDALDLFAPDNRLNSYYYVYLDQNGQLATGWHQWHGKWYYMGQDYLMVTSWNKINGKWYYFKPKGDMAAKEYCDGYWLDSNGAWTYEARASWKQDSYGWSYQDTTGWYAKSEILKIDDKQYYFNEDGYRVTGWQEIDGKWHYFYADGTMALEENVDGYTIEEYVDGYKLDSDGIWTDTVRSRWKQNDTGWWYEDSAGKYPKNEFCNIDNNRYYFNENGYMVTGWKKVDNNWYFFKKDGTMASEEFCEGYWVDPNGRLTYKPISKWESNSKGSYYINQIGWYPKNQVLWIDGNLYHFSASGYVDSGWKQVDGNWYYFESDGKAVTGWKKISEKWYYFSEDCVMNTGWIKSKGSTYFLKSDGSMASKEYCNGYWLNSDGTWTYTAKASWKQDSNGWYYQDTTGWYAKNQTLKIDGKDYTFDKAGYLVE